MAIHLLFHPLLPDAVATIYTSQFIPSTDLSQCLLEPGFLHFISLPKLSHIMRRLLTTLHGVWKNWLIYQPSLWGCRYWAALVHLGAVSWVSVLKYFLFIMIPTWIISEHSRIPSHLHSMPGKKNMSRLKARLKLGIIFPLAASWQLSAQEWQLGIYG